MQEVKKFPELVSRQHYMSLYAGQQELVVKMGARDFDKIAGEGNERLPVALIDQQISDVRTSAQSIEKYADKRVAHFDRRDPARPFPTFNELTNAIETLDKTVVLYWKLLKGPSMTTLLPEIISDWQAVFRFPWKP